MPSSNDVGDYPIARAANAPKSIADARFAGQPNLPQPRNLGIAYNYVEQWANLTQLGGVTYHTRTLNDPTTGMASDKNPDNAQVFDINVNDTLYQQFPLLRPQVDAGHIVNVNSESVQQYTTPVTVSVKPIPGRVVRGTSSIPNRTKVRSPILRREKSPNPLMRLFGMYHA